MDCNESLKHSSDKGLLILLRKRELLKNLICKVIIHMLHKNIKKEEASAKL